MTELRTYLESVSDDLYSLQQNNPLDETGFIGFVRRHGIGIGGVVTGDPSEFQKEGWLLRDEETADGGPSFHPFRLYSIHKIRERRAFNREFNRPETEQIEEIAREANEIADLAILLEPIFWPSITGTLSHRGNLSDQALGALRRDYRDRIFQLIRGLDRDRWRAIHERLRVDAASFDENRDLYVLLRAGRWEVAKALTGVIAGALWLRIMAELIRRAFEDVYKEQWPEEYESGETWFVGARTELFGSERPLDDIGLTAAYVAQRYGLFSGPSVRWYVEGTTEYFANEQMFLERFSALPPRLGIELLNLHGVIEAEKDSAAVKLGEWLAEDQRQRRFSFVTVDGDLPKTLKVIRNQAEQDKIVGVINVHNPHFEFANFSAEELAEIAARRDEAAHLPGHPLRNADWTGIKDMDAFENKYLEISESHRNLKDEQWGRALGRYAAENPRRADTNEERPFVTQFNQACQTRLVPYESHKKRYRIDPKTLKLVPR